MHLSGIDYLILGIYFLFVLGIGLLLKRKMKSSSDFLMSGRNIPLWITSLAFICANLGAQEVLGMAASGAKYGLMTTHFYWIGAIPAMVFLGIFMMPFYYGSKVRSVPEYLAKRFDEKTRGFNAFTFALMTIFSSGISLYALALLLKVILGWDFEVSVLLASGIVLIYTYMGGLTSAVYNEVLQFFLIVLGIAPLIFIGLNDVGGWSGIVERLPDAMVHAWKYTGDASDNPMGVNWWQISMGLGFVLSFGYWCTDFLVVQRAMITRNMRSAQSTPLIAAIPKMFLPFIVIVPGLIAAALVAAQSGYSIPIGPDGTANYNLVLPSLLDKYYPSGLLGIGVTALFASFMSGMAGNVTAFNTVWTYDIYEAYIKPGKSDKHYLKIGRYATLFGIAASIGTAYVARSFNNIMDFLQLVFGFVNAPLFATFALGMFWKRSTGHGAFYGLVSGTVAATLTYNLTVAEGNGGAIANLHTFGSAMAQSLMVALIAFCTCLIVTWLVSLFTKPKKKEDLKGLVYSLTPKPSNEGLPWYKKPATLGVIILIVAVIFNLIFM
ncbi:MAG TPA: sodium:solute symporter family protein [Chitinophagaceae bacterium]|nr:sodium:solute symporter family protein [Chitinophagaceae bacterium]